MVPEELAGSLRELLALLAEIKAESAQAAPADEHARLRLVQVTDLLDQASRAGDPGAPVELSGPSGLLREALYGLLLDGADALAEACRAYEAGTIGLDRLCEAGASAAARGRLFARFERSDPAMS